MTRARLVRLAVALGAMAAARWPAAFAADQTIVTSGNSFVTPNRTIQVGDSVTWVNAGRGLHNVVSDGVFRCAHGCDGEAGGNGNPSTAPWSFTRTFNSAGTFFYYCEVHGGPAFGMRGTLTVQGAGGAPPAAPTMLGAVAESTSAIVLTWIDNAQDESGFKIEQRSVGGSFVEVQSAPANATAATIEDLDEAAFYLFRVRAFNSAGSSAYSNETSATTLASPGPCVADGHALCLNNDNFRVAMDWHSSSAGGGQANAGADIGASSGILYFNNPDNAEVLVKVLNGCGLANRYWVFFAATTNVEFAVTVTDTRSGLTRSYYNPLGSPASPVQDTSAFATCP